MTDRVKIGVIGTGHMGQYHVNVAKTLSDAELIGIFDSDSERATQIAEKHKTAAFPTLDDLIKNVDSIIIAVPTFLHHDIGKKALLAGKHVLVEKPIAETLEQAKELVALAEKNNLVLQVGHVERFNGAVLELGKIVTEPLLIESRRLAPYNPRIKDVGVVLDMMIHDIDIVLNLVKSPVKYLSAVGTKVVSNHEDIASVVLHFENGAIANISASRNTQAKIRTLNITQKDVYITLDFTDQEIELHRQATSDILLRTGEIKYRQESIVEKIFVHKDNPLKQEHEHFVKCIRKETEPLVYGQSDIQTLEIAYRILKEIHKN
ncbi:gfo/Idh/MocA family oxidoreductase [Leptospira wolffii]|uniref:Oxidoreductase n=1 Tax=Leptospira wolffii TaxID=409998 RepID=A0A2M9ZE26_9LEPT|nr:Gfo/Idh/MocA family oxidoreductase [Leptospira wolffii]PJZ66624.1 oxidoreductase [Leptospira wolffii]TGK61597.1 gfo/Idh/MocA family oxidoreductase [Leptospira wolffii]TGK70141.1 gfo/Idh/MocA family oxidoreductase [Leptospira wolffii]TGK77064.1 gfo/Idh/MocA family oxidoreductase [Leptospira wolffii]TGL31084.1 gfo/Idh/MocA family oxidoreductase [Leptospira wolffii]